MGCYGAFKYQCYFRNVKEWTCNYARIGSVLESDFMVLIKESLVGLKRISKGIECVIEIEKNYAFF